MKSTIRDVLGPPDSWPNYRAGEMRMPLLRDAIVVSAYEAEPNELRLAIDARGQILNSTFVVDDRNVRHRLLEVFQPGAELENCLAQEL